MAEVSIRLASLNDLPAMTAIYNHYVRHTAFTFDLTPFTAKTRRPWFDQFAAGSIHQCLVLEADGHIKGYASSMPLRPKAAYNTSVECSIYLDPEYLSNGLGRQLYGCLLDNLGQLDLHRCYGVITLPNDASIKLHDHFGFVEAARLTEVGRKFGKYWDTLWVEKAL